MIALLRRLFGRTPPVPRCTRLFVSGHPLLAVCPNCGRAGDEHEAAPPGYSGPSGPGVDWLSPALAEYRRRHDR